MLFLSPALSHPLLLWQEHTFPSFATAHAHLSKFERIPSVLVSLPFSQDIPKSTVGLRSACVHPSAYHRAYPVSWKLQVGRAHVSFPWTPVPRLMTSTWWSFNKYLFNIMWREECNLWDSLSSFQYIWVFFLPNKLLSEHEFLQAPVIIS
jgi:hypothetical protein